MAMAEELRGLSDGELEAVRERGSRGATVLPRIRAPATGSARGRRRGPPAAHGGGGGGRRRRAGEDEGSGGTAEREERGEPAGSAPRWPDPRPGGRAGREEGGREAGPVAGARGGRWAPAAGGEARGEVGSGSLGAGARGGNGGEARGVGGGREALGRGGLGRGSEKREWGGRKERGERKSRREMLTCGSCEETMINGGTVDNWTCLNFSRVRQEEVQRFCMDLIHMCNGTGMAINPNPCVKVKSASPNHVENALRDVRRRATQMLAKQGPGAQLQLLIVILPDVNDSYGKIKRVCETDIGIVSHYCLPRHASRPNKQYLENVALNINAKVVMSAEMIKLRGMVSAQELCRTGQIRIFLPGGSVSVRADQSSTLENSLSTVLANHGFRMGDFSFMCGAKPLRSDSLVLDVGFDIQANERLVGGAFHYARIPLEEWIHSRKQYPAGFFSRLWVPRDLRHITMALNYVISLGLNGTGLLGMILMGLECVHIRGKSYNGKFKRGSIFYNQNLNIMEIEATEVDLTAIRYINDLLQVVDTVIHKYLMYEDASGEATYPMHVRHLIELLQRMADEIAKDPFSELHLSRDRRSLVFFHPCTWTLSHQVNVFTGIMVEYHRGFARAERWRFLKVMCPGGDDWHVRLFMPGASTELNRLFTYEFRDGYQKEYPKDFLGRLDYTRCCLEHSLFSKLATLAALYMHWENQLPDLQRKLVIEFSGAAVAAGVAPPAGAVWVAADEEELAGEGAAAGNQGNAAGGAFERWIPRLDPYDNNIFLPGPACGMLPGSQMQIRGLTLYVRRLNLPDLTSSLCIHLSDKAVGSIEAELGSARGWLKIEGTLKIAHQQVIVLVVVFRRRYHGKLIYYLVYDYVERRST
ncbi:hypothetical protein PR202_ga13855 [Eleusine coracana subsp. coracana]|uniref:Piwi domain-containing protein n=1 Tax=Eleusine coracana subsp. coracana TaxID=191504 RepID=A0AAV5CG33_ELECO|nr:hypothetical protein PR202_ga13855 [Eleusine coracana subsp. coracana]